jgi:hypothetical protein
MHYATVCITYGLLLADAVSNSSTPSLSDAGDSLSSAADKAADKAKSAIKGISSLPGQPLAELADLNADVRGISKGYRDPAGAVQQDKAAGDKSNRHPVACQDGLGLSTC